MSDVFRQFSQKYGFHHTISSQHHPHVNGLVERSVQTTNVLSTKASEAGGNFYFALLAYRTCPSEATTFSSAQLLMELCLRTNLPLMSSVLQPATPALIIRDQTKKKQQTNYYNKQHGVRLLQLLRPGDAVCSDMGQAKSQLKNPSNSTTPDS